MVNNQPWGTSAPKARPRFFTKDQLIAGPFYFVRNNIKLHWPPFPKGAYGDSGIYTYLLFIFRTDTTVSVLKFVDFVSEGFKVYLSQGEKMKRRPVNFKNPLSLLKNRFQNSQKTLLHSAQLAVESDSNGL